MPPVAMMRNCLPISPVRSSHMVRNFAGTVIAYGEKYVGVANRTLRIDLKITLSDA